MKYLILITSVLFITCDSSIKKEENSNFTMKLINYEQKIVHGLDIGLGVVLTFEVNNQTNYDIYIPDGTFLTIKNNFCKKRFKTHSVKIKKKHTSLVHFHNFYYGGNTQEMDSIKSLLESNFTYYIESSPYINEYNKNNYLANGRIANISIETDQLCLIYILPNSINNFSRLWLYIEGLNVYVKKQVFSFHGQYIINTTNEYENGIAFYYDLKNINKDMVKYIEENKEHIKTDLILDNKVGILDISKDIRFIKSFKK